MADTVVASLPLITASLTGSTRSTGLEGMLPLLTAELYATAGELTSIAATLPLLRAELRGPSAMEAALPLLRAEIFASAGSTSSLRAALPLLSAQISAQNPNTGELRARLPLLVAQLGASTVSIAQVEGVLPMLTAFVRGTTGARAELRAELPMLTASMQLAIDGRAKVTAVLPMLGAALVAASASPQAVAAEFATWCMNTRSFAVTEYTGFDFNSFARLGARYLAAGPDGLFLLNGLTDAGADIDPVVRTGFMDLGKGELVRVPEITMALRAERAVRVRVSPNEDVVYDYTLPSSSLEGLRQRRVKLGKGMRSRYYRVELRPMGGGRMDIDRMSLDATKTTRKVG